MPPKLPTIGSIRTRNGASVAQKVQPLFVDDVDGSPAEGTIRFGLDGTDYEIDLNTEHAQALRDALAPYIGSARRASGAARRPPRGGRKASANGVNTTEVREWAKAQGMDVKDRGRVPAELVVRCEARPGASPRTPPSKISGSGQNELTARSCQRPRRGTWPGNVRYGPFGRL